MNRNQILILLVFVVIALQLAPVERTNPPEDGEVPAPAQVQAILERSCYDCHSNRTRWPWYAHVAPVSFLVVHDVNEGREHVNFTTWNRYDAKKREHIFEEIVEVIEEKEMPLWFYVPLHPEAELSDADRELLIDWAKREQQAAARELAASQ